MNRWPCMLGTLFLASTVGAEDLDAYRLAEGCDYPASTPGVSLAAPGLVADNLRGSSPAVPVSGVLYLPQFQARHAPTWPGNLKKLRWQGGSALDATGQPALETHGDRVGQLKMTATTLWTRPDQAFGTSPDGADLQRGGAGQQLMLLPAAEIPESSERRVLVEPREHQNGVLADIPSLQADVETARELQASLGVMTEAQALSALRWARGLPADEGDMSPPWRLGGILHSQPVVVDYGSAPGEQGAQRRRILFGTQWGFLHMLADDADAPGREIFAYLPRGQLPRLATLAGVADFDSGFDHGADGSPVVLRRDVDGDGHIEPADGDRIRVVFGMRRGGRGLQMLDISNPDGPPRLLWRLRPRDAYQHLGLSFSTPRVGRVLFEEGEREVLMFGAGYHGGNDGEGNPVGKDAGDEPDPLGNAILMVDAATGTLIWQATAGMAGASAHGVSHPELRHSVPSPLGVLRNSRGLIYRAYVGDSGGNVWRLDLPPGRDPEQRARYWRVTRLARLGDAGDNSEARRFFHAPAVFRARDDSGAAFDGVVIASGNQADPLRLDEQDYLFYLRDYQVEVPATELPAVRAVDLPDIADCELDIPLCRFGQRAGWKMALQGPGEKGLSSPRVVAGRLWFTSYLPPQSRKACEPALGRSRLYRIQLRDGAASDLIRMLTLAPGLPASLQKVGWQAWVPAGPVPADWLPREQSTGSEGSALPRQLLPLDMRRLVPLYWRDLDRE